MFLKCDQNNVFILQENQVCTFYVVISKLNVDNGQIKKKFNKCFVLKKLLLEPNCLKKVIMCQFEVVLN